MLRLLIADDHTLFRFGLKQMLQSFPGIEVVGGHQRGTNSGSGQRGNIDLLLTDLTMPGNTGTQLITSVRAACPSLPILVLSMHDEPATVRRALQAGANGYVTKEATPEVLHTAITRVAAGERYVAPSVAHALALETLNHGSGERHDHLSPREWEVLRLIVSGTSLNRLRNN
jgi:DNA-binding NarL/FixJ family response regulator